MSYFMSKNLPLFIGRRSKSYLYNSLNSKKSDIGHIKAAVIFPTISMIIGLLNTLSSE